jgi:DNA-binding transcriptional LysR family regulator
MDLRVLGYFVAVAEEGHIGRAAQRLGMTQPPLSRAMRALEHDLGVGLLERTARGVTLTPSGATLLVEARDVLARAALLRERVRGPSPFAIGTLADTADLVGGRLVAAFRDRHPGVEVSVHEADLGDPTAGLRAGRVDVALTRTPFDDAGLGTRVLAAEPVGVVVLADDAVAGRASVAVAELAGREWVRMPDGDPVWRAYWSGGEPEGPVVRTIQECLQSVLWNGRTALAPVEQPVPPGLTVVPVDDRPPSELVVAWRDESPLVRSFVEVAVLGSVCRISSRPAKPQADAPRRSRRGRSNPGIGPSSALRCIHLELRGPDMDPSDTP